MWRPDKIIWRPLYNTFKWRPPYKFIWRPPCNFYLELLSYVAVFGFRMKQSQAYNLFIYAEVVFYMSVDNYSKSRQYFHVLFHNLHYFRFAHTKFIGNETTSSPTCNNFYKVVVFHSDTGVCSEAMFIIGTKNCCQNISIPLHCLKITKCLIKTTNYLLLVNSGEFLIDVGRLHAWLTVIYRGTYRKGSD